MVSIVIYQYELSCIISAQLDQGIKHFLHKVSDKAETCIGSCAQLLNYGTWGLDGNGESISRRSSTKYLGIFLATKMVVPLESGSEAILALSRKK